MLDIDQYRQMFLAWPWVWIVASMLAGACLASFGGVVVDRLPHSAGWRMEPRSDAGLLARSRCDSCGKPVGVLAGLPVIGWLVLRGRCNHCAQRVPAIYPVVEGATALASGGWAWIWGPTPGGALGLVVLWCCVVLAWIDWREGWLPDRILAPLTIVGLLCSPFVPDPYDRILGLALCVGALCAAFAWLSWRQGRNMYLGGDIMFVAAGGAWLGYDCVPQFLLATGVLYLAHNAFLRLRSIHWQPADPAMREEIGTLAAVPMGPAIALALVGCALCGPHLLPF